MDNQKKKLFQFLSFASRKAELLPARETFSWDDLIKVEIPIASMEIQRSIVDIYTVYKERKNINEKLKVQIKDICPILIKGSIEEARKRGGIING